MGSEPEITQGMNHNSSEISPLSLRKFSIITQPLLEQFKQNLHLAVGVHHKFTETTNPAEPTTSEHSTPCSIYFIIQLTSIFTRFDINGRPVI